MKIQCERLASLGLGIILAIGAGVVWGLALLLSFVLTIEIFFPHDVVNEWDQLCVFSGGRLAVRSHSSNHGDTYRTLDGKPIKPALGNEVLPEANLTASEDQQKRKWSGDLPWSRRIQRLDINSGSERWYFVHDGKLDGRAYIVGYGRETKQTIGYIGRNGFQPNQPLPQEQFPVDGRKIVYGETIRFMPYSTPRGDGADWETEGVRACPYLLADDGLIAIDVSSRFVAGPWAGALGTAKVLWKDANIASVAMGVRERPAANRPPDKSPFLATIVLRTPDRVIILNSAGKEIAAYPIPVELRNVVFKVCQPRDNTLLIRTFGKEKLFWIDTTGKIVRYEQVELPQRSRSTTRERIEDTVGYSLCLPSPGAVAAECLCNPSRVGRCPQLQDYWSALDVALRRMWPVLLITSIVSAVLAVLCFLRQRKYGLPWTAVWTLFVLLFGLPAYFGYLAHRSWPGRLLCPTCGRLAPRDRPACFACGQEFPAPALKGTEVFA